MATDLVRGILPIFVVDPGPRATLLDFCGTGFIVARNLLVTCWHVVETQLPPNQRYGAVLRNEQDDYFISLLSNIERDLNGSDLATANVQGASVELSLATSDLSLGEHLWTYGYPLTDITRPPAGDLKFQLNPRFMRCHLMRDFDHQHQKYGRVRSYEMSIAAPDGLSGAPLVRDNAFEIVGVVYANIDVATIEAFARVDPDTGIREPEIQRVVSFGLAHHLTTLQRVTGFATSNLPLIDFLKMH